MCKRFCRAVKDPRMPRWWQGVSLYGMVWHSMQMYVITRLWYGKVCYGMIWYCKVWFGMIWYGKALLVYQAGKKRLAKPSFSLASTYEEEGR